MSGNTIAGKRLNTPCGTSMAEAVSWLRCDWRRFPYDGDVWPGGEGVQHHGRSVPGAGLVQQLPLLQVTPWRPGVTAHKVSEGQKWENTLCRSYIWSKKEEIKFCWKIIQLCFTTPEANRTWETPLSTSQLQLSKEKRLVYGWRVLYNMTCTILQITNIYSPADA